MTNPTKLRSRQDEQNYSSFFLCNLTYYQLLYTFIPDYIYDYIFIYCMYCLYELIFN